MFHMIIPSSFTFSNMQLNNIKFQIFQDYIKLGLFSGKLDNVYIGFII